MVPYWKGGSLNPKAVSYGCASGPHRARASLVIRSVSASLLDQVREKKDVPLGPEDPKEEDGSFDYRCVTSAAPARTQRLSGGLSSPP